MCSGLPDTVGLRGKEASGEGAACCPGSLSLWPGRAVTAPAPWGCFVAETVGPSGNEVSQFSVGPPREEKKKPILEQQSEMTASCCVYGDGSRRALRLGAARASRSADVRGAVPPGRTAPSPGDACLQCGCHRPLPQAAVLLFVPELSIRSRMSLAGAVEKEDKDRQRKLQELSLKCPQSRLAAVFSWPFITKHLVWGKY